MSPSRLPALTVATMIAFAGNSLLARVALRDTGLDAASFTAIRIVSGALVLWLIARGLKKAPLAHGGWVAAAALFAYAIFFSLAYTAIPAGTGALVLFACVQATMIGWGLVKGERFRPIQIAGLVLAGGGLVALVLPGVSAPPLLPTLSMALAGLAWGLYSLEGRKARDAVAATAGNFIRAVPMALAALAFVPLAGHPLSPDPAGIGWAVASGALASGLGYAIWYTVVPRLKATIAATAQLSVPVIAALGGVALLGEPPTLRLAAAGLAVLGGIALVVFFQKRLPPPTTSPAK